MAIPNGIPMQPAEVMRLLTADRKYTEAKAILEKAGEVLDEAGAKARKVLSTILEDHGSALVPGAIWSWESDGAEVYLVEAPGGAEDEPESEKEYPPDPE